MGEGSVSQCAGAHAGGGRGEGADISFKNVFAHLNPSVVPDYL